MLSALPPPLRPLNQPETIDFIGSNCNMPRISPPATSPSPAQKKPSAAHGLTHRRAPQCALPRLFALFRASSIGAPLFVSRVGELSCPAREAATKVAMRCGARGETQSQAPGRRRASRLRSNPPRRGRRSWSRVAHDLLHRQQRLGGGGGGGGGGGIRRNFLTTDFGTALRQRQATVLVYLSHPCFQSRDFGRVQFCERETLPTKIFQRCTDEI